MPVAGRDADVGIQEGIEWRSSWLLLYSEEYRKKGSTNKIHSLVIESSK